MTTAKDRHLTSQLTLDILVRQVLRKVGGTGADISPEQYIADLLKEWSNTRDRLMLAIRCFTEIRDECSRATSDAHRNAPTHNREIRLHGKLGKQPSEGQGVGRLQQEKATSDLNGDGWLICGVGRAQKVPPG